MQTKRGQFRSVNMDELQRWKDSPLWDDESSRNQYGYPVLLDVQRAAAEGERISKNGPPSKIYELGHLVCTDSPLSHIGPYRWAIDFLVPDGTAVIAARDGVVIEVQEHSNKGGPSPEYRDHLNYITVAHENGEFSQYCHLAQNSVSGSGLQSGSRIAKGQKLGLVGQTGWSYCEHLHFIVFRGARNESPFTFKSLKVQFKP